MDNKIVLERKLSNRMSRQDLISRGIISQSQAGVFVSSNLSQINRIQKGNFINSRISQRPSKEDLTKLRILHIGLDSREASLVREKLNEHLKTRPGPLEVFDYLVYSTSNGQPRSIQCHPLNITNTQNNMFSERASHESVGYFIVDPVDGSFRNVSYGDQQNIQLEGNPFPEAVNSNPLFFNSNEVPDEPFNTQKHILDRHVKPNVINKKAKPFSIKKFTNYNFHEYQPKATATGNRFIKCTDTRNASPSNYQESQNHYKELIEQQTLFLQYEVANRSGGSVIPKKPIHQDVINSFFQSNQTDISLQEHSFNMGNNPSNGPCSQLGANTPFMMQSENVNNEFKRFPVSQDVHMDSPSTCVMVHKPGYSIPQHLFKSPSLFENHTSNNNRMMQDTNSNILASLMDDENIISDVRSSDYMNSLYSELSDIEQPYVGFGGMLDFDDFPSISEKVAHYEQLSTHVP